MSYFLGDSRLRHRVVFEREAFMLCVYCGSKAETREHAPSKVFMQSPLPTNLPTVPACFRCNQSYSNDELYVQVLLELMKKHFFSEYSYNKKMPKRLKRRAGKEAENAFKSYITDKNLLFNDIRIQQVLHKLAICHALYELSEVYDGTTWDNDLNSIKYNFAPFMSKDELDEMNDIEFLSTYPEIGSIGRERLLVMEVLLTPLEDGEQKKVLLPISTWNDVQEGNYRYMAFVDESKLTVKIVISEFLYSEIHFNEFL